MQAWMQWLTGAGVVATLTVGLPSIVPPPAPGDSGDSGVVGTTDTALDDTGPDDTGPADTGPADTGPVDTDTDTGVDSGLTTDSAVPSFSAGDLANEKGEFGCSVVAAPGIGLLWVVGLGAAMVRRRASLA